MSATSESYEPTPEVRQIVQSYIPPNQKRINISFHANIFIGNKKYQNGIVALTEHFIITIAKGLMGGYKLLQIFHIIDILHIEVTQSIEMQIEFTHNQILKLYSTAVINFTRSLLRNCVFGLPLYPSHDRFTFQAYDTSKFPRFQPKLSPAQLFQLQYNSECSYYKTNYSQHPVLYYSMLLRTGNPTFNCNHLPVIFTDSRFGTEYSLEPLLEAVAYSPFTHIISLDSLRQPNLMKIIARAATRNKACKAIRFRNCDCTTGGKDFLNEFIRTDTDYPIYYDFSGNHLRDFPDLMKSLQLITAPLVTLNFEFCDLDEDTLIGLFTSIRKNDSLWGLQELLIAGNPLTARAINALSNLIRKLDKHRYHALNTISFGPTLDIESALLIFSDVQRKLRHLRIYNTVISLDSIYDLCRLLRSSDKMNNFELIDCSIQDEDLDKLLTSIIENQNCNEICLNFSGMKMSDARFGLLIKKIREGLGTKLISLVLDRTKFTLAHLNQLLTVFDSLPHLSYLSLNGNLNQQQGMAESLVKLTEIPTLTSLSLNGLGISALKGDLIPLLEKLATNTTLKHIDVSKNLIGPDGYKAFFNLILNNKTLQTARFSSTELKNPQCIMDILSIVAQHETLCNTCLFRDDVIRIMTGKPPNIIDQYVQLLIQALEKNYQNMAAAQAIPDEYEFAQSSLSTLNSAVLSQLFPTHAGTNIGGGGVCTGGPPIDIQDPWMGTILDDATIELKMLMQSWKVSSKKHLKFMTALFGLPMPFQELVKPVPAIYNVDTDNERDNPQQASTEKPVKARSQTTKSLKASGTEASEHSPILNYIASTLLTGYIQDTHDYNPINPIIYQGLINRRPELVTSYKDFNANDLYTQSSFKYGAKAEKKKNKHKTNSPLLTMPTRQAPSSTLEPELDDIESSNEKLSANSSDTNEEEDKINETSTK